MNLLRLALGNIRDSAFRSSLVLLCAALVVGFILTTTMISLGARRDVEESEALLGADLVVVSQGANTQAETALYMGAPEGAYMSGDTVREVATVRGVRAAAAQFFLASVPVPDPSSSDAFDALLVAFDPETDLTIGPWLADRGQRLGANEVIAGADISSPSGHIEVFGSDLVLKGNLTRTGTDLDRALFVSTETARTLAQGETAALAGPLSEGAATTILVKVDRDADAHEVALQIIQDVPGVSPIEAPGLFRSLRAEMRGLIDVSVVVLVSAWLLSVVIVGLIFAVSANERRREVTVLRALGCSRPFVFRLLLTEASLLSLAGALFGIALVAPGAYLWREQIAGALEIPFFVPSAMRLLELAGAGIALTIVSVASAAAVPAARLGLEDSTITE